MTDHDYDPPTKRELAQELGIAYEPTFTRRSLWQSYGGPRIDGYGRDREGRHYESYDGGLDEWRSR